MGEFVVVDADTGEELQGEPDAFLASNSVGLAWLGANGTWHARQADDPAGTAYRLVQVLGGPDLDPNWYENTVENLDTSEDL